MTDEIQNLPDDPTLLKQLLLEQKMLIAELREEKQLLLEQFRLAQQKTFGASGEAHPGQGQLFDEAEAEALAENSESSTVEGHTRHRPKRKPLPADLPREVIVLDIPEEDKVCRKLTSSRHR